tara:strand:- start:2942 stop:4999 length:2058 start_codon:yes stop_codon:yes gene_type:complete
MFIDSISLKNFGIYGDEPQKFEFKQDPKKPFHIIVGRSGVGKTTLWQALNWGFFGDSMIKTFETQDKDFCLYNLATQANCKKDKKNFKVEVVIHIKLDSKDESFLQDESKTKNRIYKITRTQMLKANGAPYDDCNISVHKIDKGLSEPLESDPQVFISSFLPSGIRPYYFYDGATTDFQSLVGNKAKVKKAVDALSGLDLYDDTIEIIGQYDKALPIQVELTDEYIKTLKSEVSGAEEVIKDVIKRRDKAIDDEKQANEDIKIYKPIVDSHEELKNLWDKISGLDTQIRNFENRAEDQENLISKFYNRDFFNIILDDAYKNITKSIGIEIENDIWPQGISTEQLNILSKRMKMNRGKNLIQEASVEENLSEKEASKFLFNLMEKIKLELLDSSLQGKEITRLKEGIEERMKDTETKIDDLKKFEDNLSDFKLQARKIDKVRKRVLKESGIDDTSKPPEEIKEVKLLNDAVSLSKISKNKIQKEIDNKKKWDIELDRRRLKLEKALGKKGGSKHRLKQREILLALNKKLKNYRENYQEMNRVEVEKNLKRIYLGFWKHDSQICDVQINKDYEVKVLTSNGTPIKLSKGQNITLAVAFVVGIIKSCGLNNLPFAIDAPAGNIDDELAINVYQVLSKETNQTILFLLPQREYVEGSKEKIFIDKYSSNGYKITKNKKSQIEYKEIYDG